MCAITQPRPYQIKRVHLIKLQLPNRVTKEGHYNVIDRDNDLVDVTPARGGNLQLTGHKLYKTKIYKDLVDVTLARGNFIVKCFEMW